MRCKRKKYETNRKNNNQKKSETIFSFLSCKRSQKKYSNNQNNDNNSNHNSNHNIHITINNSYKDDQKDEHNIMILQKMKPFWKKHYELFITSNIKELLNMTSSYSIIPRYFMIDACLSSNFNITMDQCKLQWEKELEFARKVDLEVSLFGRTNPNIPRLLLGARFAIAILKHIVFSTSSQSNQPQPQKRTSYNMFARNFFIGLLISSQCSCAAYTFYVASMIHLFHYYDVVSEYNTLGHVFTLCSSSDMNYSIGIDAGYTKNDKIQITIYGNNYQNESYDIESILNCSSTSSFSTSLSPFEINYINDEIKRPVLTDNQYYFGNKFKNHKKSKYDLQFSSIVGNLYIEPSSKHRFVTFIRNQFLLITIIKQHYKEHCKKHYTEQYTNDEGEDINEDMNDYQIAIQYAKCVTVYHILEKHGYDIMFDSIIQLKPQIRLSILQKAYQLVSVLFQNKYIGPIASGLWDKELSIKRGLFALFEYYIKEGYFTLQNYQVIFDIDQEFHSLFINSIFCKKDIAIYGREIIPEHDYEDQIAKTCILSIIYQSMWEKGGSPFYQVSLLDITKKINQDIVMNMEKDINNQYNNDRCNTQCNTQCNNHQNKTKITIYVQESDLMIIQNIMKTTITTTHITTNIPTHMNIKTISNWKSGIIIITQDFSHRFIFDSSLPLSSPSLSSSSSSVHLSESLLLPSMSMLK